MPEQPELLERIAKVLREHRPKDVADDKSRPGFRIWRNGCTGCGFTADKDEAIDHFDHLAARLLALPGIAIVQLSEPDDDHHDGIAFWWQAAEVGASDGMVVTRIDPGSESIWFNPDVARSVAAALLAAAGVAEEQHG